VKRSDPYMEHMARWKFARLAGTLKDCARQYGYALIVHGSLAYDIDMVAVPWTESAVSNEDLVARMVETIRLNNEGVAFLIDGQSATPAPHGRRSWNIHIGGTYIDLSVMPLAPTPESPATKEEP
jgi:hypothetical protein